MFKICSNSDSIGKLKKVLIGNVSKKTLLKESKEWNVPFEKLKYETESDRAYIVKVLTQLGIEVVEIPYIDVTNTDLVYDSLASVRNNILILNNEIIESISYKYKNKVYFKQLQDLFKENKVNSLRFEVDEGNVDNSLKCKDETFFNNYQLNKPIEKYMYFDCANILRFYDNIFMNISTKSNIYAYHYLKNKYPQYKWHPLSVCREHIDGTITILKEGLLLLHSGYIPCWKEMLPPFFHSWDKIFYPTPWLDENSYILPELNRGTTDINILILDKDRILVDEHTFSFYLKKLRKYNIMPIPVKLRHKYCWVGGIHCITNDLVRED